MNTPRAVPRSGMLKVTFFVCSSVTLFPQISNVQRSSAVLIPARVVALVEECADVAAYRGLHSLEQQRDRELVVRLEQRVQFLGQELLSPSAPRVVCLHEVCCELLHALHVDRADIIDLKRTHAG